MSHKVAESQCDCGAETEGKWADIHSLGCNSLKASPTEHADALESATSFGHEIGFNAGIITQQARVDALDSERNRLREVNAELLSALKGLVKCTVNPHDHGEFEDGEFPPLDTARAAIAKAEAMT